MIEVGILLLHLLMVVVVVKGGREVLFGTEEKMVSGGFNCVNSGTNFGGLLPYQRSGHIMSEISDGLLFELFWKIETRGATTEAEDSDVVCFGCCNCR